MKKPNTLCFLEQGLAFFKIQYTIDCLDASSTTHAWQESIKDNVENIFVCHNKHNLYTTLCFDINWSKICCLDLFKLLEIEQHNVCYWQEVCVTLAMCFESVIQIKCFYLICTYHFFQCWLSETVIPSNEKTAFSCLSGYKYSVCLYWVLL